MHGRLTIVLLLCAGLFGCKTKTEPPPAEYRLLLAADPYAPLMRQEAEQYMSLYSGMKIDVRGTSTREAIVLLINDSVRSIVIDRQFNEEESRIIQQAGIKIAESRIAEDGIAIIVHKRNSLSRISPETVRKIITGETSAWDQIRDSRLSGAIEVALTGKNSGMYELLQKKIFPLSKEFKPSILAADQHDVIQYVLTHPRSIGCVAASLAHEHEDSVIVLPVLFRTAEGKEQAVAPQQQELYSALYPFHYSLYLYNAEAKTTGGIGFSALVLSNVGQKIIQRAGLAPAALPYRTIQLHAE